MEKIYFYYMPFCPRSYFSLRNLKKEIKASDLELKCIKKFFYIKNKIIFIPPVLVYKNRVLAGFYLNPHKIRKFLNNLYE